MNKLRILLADDHAMIREGLKMMINVQADMECIGEADNGRAALQLARDRDPDIVVMDISMPELSGVQATEQLKQTHPHIKVLVLTRHKDDAHLQQLLRAGATGYVLKQSAASELIHAIRALASGHNYLDPAITENIVSDYVGKRARQAAPANISLSDRETEVLRYVAWGYSNKDIAQTLGISVKTVETHKANGMLKLGLRSRIEVVRFALLQGWLQEAE
ncbi:MAG: response regulator transcription factor [Acidobacteria bacterium]|nr:response regulator transcription factor [Acidobacteriota bacterium]